MRAAFRFGLALLALAFSACALAAAAKPLRIALQLEPPILDPSAGAAAPISELVYGNVFEGLLSLGEDGQARPRLALSWTLDAQGLDYRFQLRPGVRFHDGTPFDAAVAKFSLDRARASDSVNPRRAALAAIERVEVIAPLQLRIVLRQRAGSLLQTLGSGALVMVAPASAAGNVSHPVGTGPYRFESWRRGESVELRAYEGYWGGRPAIAALRYQFISDPSAAYAALMAGDLDLFSNFPAPENLAQFKADPRFRVSVGSSEGETLLAYNHRHAPLDQRLVRQALAHALDRRAIIEAAMYGYGQPIGSHFPPQHAAALDLTGLSAYDPARARALLAQAGVPPGLELQLKLPPTPYARRSGEIIAAQLAQVGLRLKVQNLEWAQWIDQVFQRHDFDLTVIVHAEPQDYDIYGREDYYFGYRSPRYQALLAELEASSEPQARHRLLQALQRHLAEDAANGFLFQYPRLLVQRQELQGLQFNGGGSIELAGARLALAEAPAPTAAGASAPGLCLLAWGAGGLLLAGLLFLLRSSSPRWLAQRGLGLLLTLILASVLVFALVQLAPGDPARYMMGLNADEQAVNTLRQQLGLEAPAWQRYGQWIGGLLRGDFGTSYTYRVPVAQLIGERLQVSLPLTAYALLLAVLIALPAGLLAAYRPGSLLGRTLEALTQIGIAVPNFWLGLLLALLFAVGLRWIPAGGFVGWEAGLGQGLRSLSLPALALALPQAAILARVLRTSLLEVLHEDYLRSARAKGLSAWRALWRHALPNALLPVLTLLGMQFSFLLAGAVIIENLFFLPGLGRLLFQAVAQRDLILIQSLVLLLVLAVVLLSFVVELGYRAADPRLAQRGGAA